MVSLLKTGVYSETTKIDKSNASGNYKFSSTLLQTDKKRRVCRYACIDVYACMHVHVCMYACMHVCMYACACMGLW